MTMTPVGSLNGLVTTPSTLIGLPSSFFLMAALERE